MESTRSPNELHWPDLKIEYWDKFPSNGRQGDMAYYRSNLSQRSLNKIAEILQISVKFLLQFC